MPTNPSMNGKSNHAPLIPLRDFFRNPDKTGYRISPDGNYVSHTEPYEHRMNVFVEPRDAIGQGKAVRVTSETARDISGYWWKNHHALFYTRDFGGDENFHLFAVNKDGTDPRDLTPFEGVKVEVVD